MRKKTPTVIVVEETEIAAINLCYGVKFPLITLQKQTSGISNPFRMSNANKQERIINTCEFCKAPEAMLCVVEFDSCGRWERWATKVLTTKKNANKLGKLAAINTAGIGFRK